MILDAHGIRVRLPAGWSGRVFSRHPGVATLHAGNFTLMLADEGEFGDRSTAAMRAGASFVALTEYRADAGLQPRSGLFASPRIPLPLDPARFAKGGLAHPRPGQAGMQHFFTASGRPFCLYVVIARGQGHRRRQLMAVDHLLHSLQIASRR